MGWAQHYIAKLQRGETVQFRPRGNSMVGKVESGQLVTVAPLSVARPDGGYVVEDIVLCRVAGAEYLHLIKAVKQERFLIGNNRGRINGWTGLDRIYGLLTKVEP